MGRGFRLTDPFSVAAEPKGKLRRAEVAVLVGIAKYRSIFRGGLKGISGRETCQELGRRRSERGLIAFELRERQGASHTVVTTAGFLAAVALVSFPVCRLLR
ncbi:hypothetical protein [Paracoccus beibuensis]|uniref:hypothetical protein n=1 Tax=Paracoccus beibuensis TaxID=547602 RepID=UPI0022405703|nr:hypothetical protein [Paracoccus beibuensis]